MNNFRILNTLFCIDLARRFWSQFCSRKIVCPSTYPSHPTNTPSISSPLSDSVYDTAWLQKLIWTFFFDKTKNLLLLILSHDYSRTPLIRSPMGSQNIGRINGVTVFYRDRVKWQSISHSYCSNNPFSLINNGDVNLHRRFGFLNLGWVTVFTGDRINEGFFFL